MTAERDYVKARAKGLCELCKTLGVPTVGTEFAHWPPRSQPGSADDRYHGLWTCHPCNLAMQGPFSKGRPLITRGLGGLSRRGFFVEWVRAKDKWAYKRGDYTTIAAGFIPAEKD